MPMCDSTPTRKEQGDFVFSARPVGPGNANSFHDV